ncbi:MAG: tRNA (adenosine(37)-N6)-threonylcarbamoyltransferase complex dimerization subunit type 1 TsaB [Desulfobulbaceae bacterium]|uniref:tRNA (Adenosine(37)-N6)-threonylcarbamoyltransferase complex dimerization subunit type 1 TsaB n=1 Tax=Candidatus Desulfobia pelagia TaxID=2841692 RepID=A0A8J6NF33_9BACT|nr:tRNA (adenosine(37)-N6)-threonylcarbamoyltransferase complex dimerization subunit type 1 TsaB [Candidatus Desulfobia pelagia]
MAPIIKAPVYTSPVILAIENTGICGSVALVSSSQCIGEHSLQTRLTHSKRLLSSISYLMEEAQLDWKQLDAIAISLGPGSFTGLRIGLSTVKGLSLAGSIPLIGVPTLEAMAYPFSYATHQICSIIDARKKEVYTALFRPDAHGSLHRLSEDMVISPEELARKITTPTLLIGDGAALYSDLFNNLLGPNAIFPSPHLSFPRAVHIGFHAIPLWERKEFLDPSSAAPIYIRPSDAETHANKS